MSQARVMQQVIIALLAIVLLTLSVPTVGAQSGGASSLTWKTVDSGGGASTGGAYALTGTMGQPDAGGVNGEAMRWQRTFGLTSTLQRDVSELPRRFYVALVVSRLVIPQNSLLTN